jgi:hypothetical protein
MSEREAIVAMIKSRLSVLRPLASTSRIVGYRYDELETMLTRIESGEHQHKDKTDDNSILP